MPDGRTVGETVRANEAMRSAIGIGVGFATPVGEAEAGYLTANAAKAYIGKAGVGNAWHHIVEQNSSNPAKFGARAIHRRSTKIK